MKKRIVFGLLIILLLPLFITVKSEALTNEENIYITQKDILGAKMIVKLNDLSNALQDISDTKNIDYDYLIKLAKDIDKITYDAYDIDCPPRFKRSHKYYLLAMDYIHEFAQLFISALYENDTIKLNNAFAIITEASQNMDKSNELFAMELKEECI